MNDDKM